MEMVMKRWVCLVVTFAVVVGAVMTAAAVAPASSSPHTPVVLMHGITATNESLSHAVELIRRHLPGVYVTALEVTGSSVGSVFTGCDRQVDLICRTLASDPNLVGKRINVMGFSQGGILMRGFLERCNVPQVNNFISWVSPMMGVYGVPVVGHWEYLNVTLDDMADCCAYDDWAQRLFSFAGYWRDPYDLAQYADKMVFLSDINNERASKSAVYKQRILSLKHFVMGYSLVDETLIPRETGWFGSFANNSVSAIVPLEEQPMYKFDWIGLRTLAESGRLHRFTTECAHGDYDSACFDKYFLANVLPYLLND